jgi:hypothetical protein
VLGMIIVLRIHAFLSLITAAIVVSVLAPGELGEKISRVADAFGTTAGKIGVVIALAAVIGKCLIESGAADRIVRLFVGLLGEKRCAVSLMSIGFVLKEDIIKVQHHCSSTGRWRAKAKAGKFYLIMHEHLFVFRKSKAGEDLARLRNSRAIEY